jgi:hypothetical protein
MRILAIDPGMNLGFAAVGDDGLKPISGSRRLKGGPREMGLASRHFDQVFRELLFQIKPDQVAFATPFVGMVIRKPVVVAGKKIWKPVRQAIAPDNIRPLFGILTVLEMICAELKIPVSEWEEGQARRAFLWGKVPKQSKDIKAAVIRACRQRGWPATDDHAADALCIAAWALDNSGGHPHETTPLFQPIPKTPILCVGRSSTTAKRKKK